MKPAARHPDRQPSTPLLDQEAKECERHPIHSEYLDRALVAGAQQFLARPGKGIRSRVIEGCFLVAGGNPAQPPKACFEAIEILHGGSLIIDDIQDDAETRRGAQTVHKQVGVPCAINIGNWLYFVALARLDELDLEPAAQLRLTRAAHACLMRCHEGQALDLTLRIGDVKRSEVPAIAHTTSTLKTGALMGFAARLGASVAGAAPDQVQALEEFGQQVGVALQMLDDLGSFVASERSHKAIEDLSGQRVSWVWAWASEVLDEVTFKQLARQVARGDDLDDARLRLAEAVETLGRARVHDALAAALCTLEHSFENSPALRLLARELTSLEQSYG